MENIELEVDQPRVLASGLWAVARERSDGEVYVEFHLPPGAAVVDDGQATTAAR